MFPKLIAKFNRLPTIQKIVVLAVIAYIGFWLYKRYVVRQREGMHGAGSDSGNGEVVCTLYYTDWCPHCKTVKPEWFKLRDAMHGKQVSGKTVQIKMVNCEEDKAAAEAAGVKGFPTIKISVNGNVRDYSGERTFSGFQQYISAL